jgi:hypothetical protein
MKNISGKKVPRIHAMANVTIFDSVSIENKYRDHSDEMGVVV